jgi:endonuclease/exonuclease/phosphatase family metal-dependent hydrolase
MASKLRIVTRRFLFLANITVVLLFLLSCLAPFVDPRGWWFISFLGLAFPFLLILTVLFLIGWLILLRPRFALLSFCALLIGYKSIVVFFAFHIPGSFRYNREAGTIRIVDWNVARFIEMKRNNNKGSQTRTKMIELLRQQNADILCLQEFFHSFDSTYYANIDDISKELNYPYWFYSHDVDGDKHFTGNIIFSRFPIVDSGLIRFPRPTLPEALMHADIKVNGDTIRVYTTHLQSLQLGKSDYERLGEIKNAEDSILENSKTILSKLKRGFTHRSIQAEIIKEVLGDSPYPVIFCGDLNDVPNSFTYTTVRGGMQDAFLKKGFGIGRTYAALSPTLRIDYIFADVDFSVRQFTRIIKNYSDHYTIVADLSLRKPRKKQ